MRKPTSRIPVMVLVALLCLVALATFGADAAPPATNVLVDGVDGLDKTGCGDWTKPCATIGYALDQYRGQDPNVYIRPGRYTEQLEIDHDATLIGGYTLSGSSLSAKGDTTIIDADRLGSAVEVNGATVELRSLTLTGGSGFNGGGMDIRDADVTLSDCIITDNQATYGAGLYIDGDTTMVVIEDSRITANLGVSAGGGIYCYESVVALYDSEVSDNSAASGDGGAIAMADGTVGLTRCTLSGNTASDDGGMAHIDNTANLGLSNCLVLANDAVAGVGDVIRGNNSLIQVTSSTVAHNDPGQGEAVFIVNCDFTSRNSIWWGNGDLFGGGDINTRTVQYCDVEGGWRAEGNISQDPQFIRGGDYRLAEGSPCIDAGSSTPSDTDLVGNDRTVDGDGDGSAITDMGCYEAVAVYRLMLPMMR